MVVINLGYTAPINPPDASPHLTLAQVWTGLQYKVRRAEKFVPIITACEVLSEAEPATAEDERSLTRRVTFQPGVHGPVRGRDAVVEVCKLYPPCRVDFVQENGTTIGNYVSEGPGGELMMTYVFQWKVAGVEEGSEEAAELEGTFRKTAKIAVEGSIQTIRDIASGKIAMD